jgi:serine protease Do
MEVTLKDGSRFPAKLIGSDEKTDLAVLKIDADRALPVVAWGDSDKARVGDWVVAVGNPFGLSGTATAGIISSRGRDIGAGPYDDFIQIDAPINTGNSGGPLFDTEGAVIGVNTAIYSPSGGNVGIGFAIPSNAARKVVAELQEKGTVSRGWLGVAIQPVTPDVADSLGLSKAAGALVATVTPDSPAEQAGLRQGDVILAFNGEDIASPRELSRAVADADAGEKGKLQVWRGNREIEVSVRVGEMPKQVASGESGPASVPGGHSEGGVQLGALGLTLAPLDDAARQRWGLSEDASGVLVASVDAKGDAAEKGVQPGDVITRVNQDVVKTPADVQKAVEKAKSAQRKSVLLLVERNGTQQFVAVELTRA